MLKKGLCRAWCFIHASFHLCWGILNALLSRRGERYWREAQHHGCWRCRWKEGFKIAPCYQALLQFEHCSVSPRARGTLFVCVFPSEAFLNSVLPSLIKSPVCLCCPQKHEVRWKPVLSCCTFSQKDAKFCTKAISSTEGGHWWCVPAICNITNSAQLLEPQI